ncbi:MAG: RagB/SusD family nutrient uptake outer membrane protein [Bacteroidales bacterium]|nr:RagB/SusD family nutrient uptake outer membrane protein [Bacteroidales bacterium]
MKKIYFGALVATVAMSAAVSLSSCEDMLEPESDLIMYPEDNQLDTPYDTLYSVVGVLHQMQAVLDRTNLLGEVRADLVTLTGSASKDLQELASSQVSTANAYNNPQDYYAIINNCNYYIDNADSTYVKQGVRVFERELALIHTYRAWTYLQLALNYGEIPFYTHFLGTQSEADEVLKQPRLSIAQVCAELIDDLLPWAYTKRLSYQSSFGSYNISNMYMSPKLILGELYLWSGQYEEAAFWYHEYLTDKDDPLPVGGSPAKRTYANGVYSSSTSYRASTGIYLPYESDAMYGTVSYLLDMYESNADNNLYYEITYSQSALERSMSQRAVLVVVNEKMERDTLEFPAFSTDAFFTGDLRLGSVVSVRAINNGKNWNTSYQTISKLSSSSYLLYRVNMVYLRYAEALNRAGYPTAAFAVLKYGLCEDNIEKRASGSPINADEAARAGQLIYFDPNYFIGTDYSSGMNGTATSGNTIGIHAMGGTAVDADTTYVIPQLASMADTVQWVEEKIVEEMALESIFDGTRFYDLMRVAMRRDDNSFLANTIAARDGSGAVNKELQSRLMDRTNWFLPFQK